MEFHEIMNLVAAIPRFLGMLVFGVGAGWLLIHLLRRHAQAWQVEAVLLVCFFGMAAAVVRFASIGSLGAYTLGAGAAMLIWGLRNPSEEPETKKK
ncbi:MAG: hypothetical protein EPO32_03360 [Anaerolineae bacterium]|nr:MAG: hypothetical protein EPO32_03360 [Anaerolineae bacterium]